MVAAAFRFCAVPRVAVRVATRYSAREELVGGRNGLSSGEAKSAALCTAGRDARGLHSKCNILHMDPCGRQGAAGGARIFRLLR